MKQDWAWNEASRLLALGAKDEPDAVRKLARALRKAKADGMREAADYFEIVPSPDEGWGELANAIAETRRCATAIEKGEA